MVTAAEENAYSSLLVLGMLFIVLVATPIFLPALLAPVWRRVKAIGRAAMGRVWELAKGVGRYIKSAATRVVNFIGGSVVAPVWRRIEGVGRYVKSVALRVNNFIGGSVVGPIWRRIKAIAHRVNSTLRRIWDYVRPVVVPIWHCIKTIGGSVNSALRRTRHYDLRNIIYIYRRSLGATLVLAVFAYFARAQMSRIVLFCLPSWLWMQAAATCTIYVACAMLLVKMLVDYSTVVRAERWGGFGVTGGGWVDHDQDQDAGIASVVAGELRVAAAEIPRDADGVITDSSTDTDDLDIDSLDTDDLCEPEHLDTSDLDIDSLDTDDLCEPATAAPGEDADGQTDTCTDNSDDVDLCELSDVERQQVLLDQADAAGGRVELGSARLFECEAAAEEQARRRDWEVREQQVRDQQQVEDLDFDWDRL